MQSSKSYGFTLIEILIVMLIISIVGGITLLAVSHNRNTQLGTYTNQLTNRLILAEQRAMLLPMVFKLVITDETLQFYQYQEATSRFTKSSDSTLGLYRIPENIHLTLKMQDEDPEKKHPEPHIIFSSSGDLTPFSLLIGSPKKPPTYEIKGDANGNIKMHKINLAKQAELP